MRKLLYIFILAFATSSCSGLLDEEIHSQVDDNYLNTLPGFEAAVMGCYSHLRDFYGQERGSRVAGSFGVDTYKQARDGGGKHFDFYSGALNSADGDLKAIWENFYRGINNCNVITTRAPNIEMSEELKLIRIGEARFLRAHYYFVLVQMFGPLHITLEETTGIQLEASRSPVNDVYKVIVEDLEYAIQNLPPSTDEWGRATEPAAKHMLARVLLTRATSPAAKDDDYERAANLAIDVINNYGFRLLDDFSDVFAVEPGDQNDEVIWSVQYNSNQLTNGEGNRMHLFFGAQFYRPLIGVANSQKYGRGWTRYMPTDFTLDHVFADRVNDVRYEKSFIQVYYCTVPGTYTINFGKEVTLEEGDTAIYLPGVNWSDEKVAEKNYTVWRPKDYTFSYYPSLTKHLFTDAPEISESRGYRDFIVARLAETYLIAAEALMYSGNNEDAVDYINAVRLRSARIGNTPEETEQYREAMKITVDQLDLDFILDERARELLGELFRWFDLVRTGLLVERVRMYNPFGGPNIQDHHVLRPIPQDQIDRTAGGAESFPQNPGY